MIQLTMISLPHIFSKVNAETIPSNSDPPMEKTTPFSLFTAGRLFPLVLVKLQLSIIFIKLHSKGGWYRQKAQKGIWTMRIDELGSRWKEAYEDLMGRYQTKYAVAVALSPQEAI